MLIGWTLNKIPKKSVIFADIGKNTRTERAETTLIFSDIGKNSEPDKAEVAVNFFRYRQKYKAPIEPKLPSFFSDIGKNHNLEFT